MTTPAQSLINRTASNWFAPEIHTPETPNQKAILIITRAVYTAAAEKDGALARLICLKAVQDVETIMQDAGRTNLLDRSPKAASEPIKT